VVDARNCWLWADARGILPTLDCLTRPNVPAFGFSIAMARSAAQVYAAVLISLLSSACFSGLADLCRAADWPQWRGPQFDGTSRESGLPLKWSESVGIAWKCKLPEWGNNTPVVCGDAIFLTSHVEEQQLVLVKIHRGTGQIAWTRQVGTGSTPRMKLGHKSDEQRRHTTYHAAHNLATPSAVTDGKLVVVHFGNGDLAVYDYAGNRLWYRNLQKDYGDYTVWWGHANSPLLYENLVISACIQDSLKDLSEPHSLSYVVAHDKQTGKEVWKMLRPTDARQEPCDGYTTPLLWHNGGRLEMIVMGGQVLDAYDPSSGKRLWYLPDLTGSRVITNPVTAHGMIYATQGMRSPLLAVRPAGDGRRSHDEVVWEHRRGASDSPTPTVWGDLLFFVNEAGIANCLDAKTGKVHWTERLEGQYRASPLAAEDRIYFLNMKGLTTVVAASAEFKKLAENQLDDETIASPIVSNGKIFIRGRKSLYCLQKQEDAGRKELPAM
jgi:outer membrane protein assembly factor BamB